MLLVPKRKRSMINLVNTHKKIAQNFDVDVNI